MSNDLKYDAIRCVIRLCDDSTSVPLTYILPSTYYISVSRFTTLATTSEEKNEKLMPKPGNEPGTFRSLV